MPGVGGQIIDVAMVAKGCWGITASRPGPRPPGSGLPIYARIRPDWAFTQVRLAAKPSLARWERRAPDLATSHWWKEDRRECSSTSTRTRKTARLRRPGLLGAGHSGRAGFDAAHVDEVPDCDRRGTPSDRFPAIRQNSDPWAAMDDVSGSLDALLRLAPKNSVRPKSR